jgi:hypothetical protein
MLVLTTKIFAFNFRLNVASLSVESRGGVLVKPTRHLIKYCLGQVPGLPSLYKYNTVLAAQGS